MNNNLEELQKLKINDLLHASLKNGTTIYGTVDMVSEDGFFIDDDLSGDVFFVDFLEVKKVYEHL